jgi:hypothetical protein
MATAIFIIPQKDADRVRDTAERRDDIAGHVQIRVQHKPFDPFGADAETQAVDEYLVHVTYDPHETTVEQLHDALTALGVHILDTRQSDP